MTTTEIKKALYKQKPIARKARLTAQEKLPEHLKEIDIYLATIKNNGVWDIIEFRVPWKDRPVNGLKDEEPAQLLIRWLHCKEEATKKTYIKIEFKNCDLDYDWTVAYDWDNVKEILDSVQSELEDSEIDEENPVSVTLSPISMTEEEYGKLVEKWEDFNE